MIEVLTTVESELPKKAHETDACADLIATSIIIDNQYIEYGTGLKMLPPEGHFGLIFPRSSISNYDLLLCNSVGVIDEYTGEWKLRFKRIKYPLIQSLKTLFDIKRERLVDENKYHKSLSYFDPKKSRKFHEIQLLKRDIKDLDNQIMILESFEKLYEVGDKIGQIMFLPKQEWNHKVLKKLPSTNRGEKGYGSTGK